MDDFGREVLEAEYKHEQHWRIFIRMVHNQVVAKHLAYNLLIDI